MSAATKFILSLPPDVPVKDVLAKAKANGIEVTVGNVYRVRRLPAATKATTKPGRPSSRPASAPRPTALSKSDFIRSVPASTPAREVVAQARNVGLDLDVHYVYKIRAAAGSKGAPKAPVLTSKGRDEPPARGGQLAPQRTSTPPGISELSVSELSADFEGDLTLLEEADAAIRILYAELAKDPDLWSRCETAVRELQSKRTELALQVGLAALRDRRAQRMAPESPPSQTTPTAELSSDAPHQDPDPATTLVSEPPLPVATTRASRLPPPPPSNALAEVPPAPVSAQRLAEFIAGLNTPASAPRVAPRPDDRTLLLALAAHVNIAEKVTTTVAFDAEAEQIERASSEERQKRWREMTREGQVRWLSVLVAWAKALEQEALGFREATLGVSAVFRELRNFSKYDAPGFVHGFARSASPRSATWREDALRLLREIRPEPVRAAMKLKAPTKASAAAGEEEETAEIEPLTDWPYLDRVKGLRIVLLGGEVREERRVALEEAFQLESLEWIPRNRPRQVASLAERAARGTVDFILVTKFVAHAETEAVSRSTKVPLLTMRHGYGVTTVRQVLEEYFLRADEKADASAGSARRS